MDTSYSYDLIYAYQSGAGHRFQLDNVRDLNYHTEETPSESTTVNNGHRSFIRRINAAMLIFSLVCSLIGLSTPYAVDSRRRARIATGGRSSDVCLLRSWSPPRASTRWAKKSKCDNVASPQNKRPRSTKS